MSGPKSPDRRRLAIVIPSAYPIGGVQTWLDYLVPGLERFGWEVTVLVVHGVHSDAHRYLVRHPFERVRIVSNASGSREGRVRALGTAIRSSRPGLVLVVNIVDVYEAVARLREKDRGAPKVAMALHGLHPSFYDDIAMCNEYIDAVIATNRLGAAAASRLGGIPGDRAYYAPCGVVIPDSLPPRIQGVELQLLFAGRFDHEKNVMGLPPILELLKQQGIAWRLRLAGAGPVEGELRAALATYGPSVEFVGVLDEARMRDSFYQPGAIALILSPSETGPLVAWEALANGVCVVTSRFSGIGLEGSLRDGETCVTFPVGDSEAAATALSRLTDPVLRQELAGAGFQRVKERYSRDESLRAWNDALRRVWEQPPLPNRVVRTPIPATGRLDRWFGAGVAESLRQVIGLRYRHGEPGGEWPHSYGSDANEQFREALRALDHANAANTKST